MGKMNHIPPMDSGPIAFPSFLCELPLTDSPLNPQHWLASATVSIGRPLVFTSAGKGVARAAPITEPELMFRPDQGGDAGQRS